jgi:hypothetical protein
MSRSHACCCTAEASGSGQFIPEPCLLPRSNHAQNQAQEAHFAAVNADVSALLSYCHQTAISVPTIIQLAWSIVLHVFTASDHVCFGYVDAVEDIHQPNNTALCHLRVDRDVPIGAHINRLLQHPLRKYGDCQCKHSLASRGNALLDTTVIAKSLHRDQLPFSAPHAIRTASDLIHEKVCCRPLPAGIVIDEF